MSIDDGLGITREQIMDMIENRPYNLLVYPEEGRIIRKLINKELEVEKETSIESLIERAKELKKAALERFPKDAENFEIYVDEDTRRIEMKFLNSDSFWNNTKIAEVIMKCWKSDKEKSEKDKVSRRIYV
jgi:hypothetical protein